jgi:hypothetical protein
MNALGFFVWKMSISANLLQGSVGIVLKFVLLHLGDWWSKGHFDFEDGSTNAGTASPRIWDAGGWAPHPSCCTTFSSAHKDNKTHTDSLCPNRLIQRSTSIWTPPGDQPEPGSVCDLVASPGSVPPSSQIRSCHHGDPWSSSVWWDHTMSSPGKPAECKTSFQRAHPHPCQPCQSASMGQESPTVDKTTMGIGAIQRRIPFLLLHCWWKTACMEEEGRTPCPELCSWV